MNQIIQNKKSVYILNSPLKVNTPKLNLVNEYNACINIKLHQ